MVIGKRGDDVVAEFTAWSLIDIIKAAVLIGGIIALAAILIGGFGFVKTWLRF